MLLSPAASNEPVLSEACHQETLNEKDYVTRTHGWGDHQRGGPGLSAGDLFGFWASGLLSRLPWNPLQVPRTILGNWRAWVLTGPATSQLEQSPAPIDP